MIYTIGHSKSYREYLANSNNPHLKLGKNQSYIGGSVWLTKEDATKYLKPGFEVFGVNARWRIDKYLCKFASYGVLTLVDRIYKTKTGATVFYIV